MKRIEFLQQAETLGDSKPDEVFELIAQYWSIYLTKEIDKDIELCSIDIPIMVTLLKMAYAQTSADRTSFVEGLSYMSIAAAMVEKTKAL
jgi:hypothetical protein